MPNHKTLQNSEEWLRIAKEDLRAAKGLLPLELFSPVTYHCQQAAEKSLKAYLVFNKQPAPKTHDLLRLLEFCMHSDKNFEKVFEAADCLNPFSMKFRYPTEFDIPDLTDAESAVQQAQRIVAFVVQKISQPETGQVSLF
jgi:HEPN domain-containing protein